MGSRKAYLVRRAHLIEVQGGLCFYCGTHLTAPDSRLSTAATLDHLFPRHGRLLTSDIARTVVACEGCNTRRGSRHYMVFLIMMNGRSITNPLV